MSRSFPAATPASCRWRHTRTIVSAPHTAATCTVSTAIAPASPEASDACPCATATSTANTTSSTATPGPSGRAASSAPRCARATTGTARTRRSPTLPRRVTILQAPLRGAQQVVSGLGEDPVPPGVRGGRGPRRARRGRRRRVGGRSCRSRHDRVDRGREAAPLVLALAQRALPGARDRVDAAAAPGVARPAARQQSGLLETVQRRVDRPLGEVERTGAAPSSSAMTA